MSFRFSIGRTFVFASAICLALSLSAQTSTSTLTGNYILAGIGTEEQGPAVSISTITFSESGVVKGHQVLRGMDGIQHTDFTGFYTIDSNGVGSLTITLTDDASGTVRTRDIHYKFLSSSTQMHVIRTDSGVQSVSYLLPAAENSVAGVSGKLSFAENNKDQSLGRVGSFTIDSAGAISGSSYGDWFGETRMSRLSGSSSSEKGFTTLQLATTTTDDVGASVITRESYIAIGAKDEVVMMRAFGGPVGLNFLSR